MYRKEIEKIQRRATKLNLTEPHPQIMIDGEELEAVDDFTYLGSNISAENSVQKDISARINMSSL